MPDGVVVARQPLELKSLVRIQVGQHHFIRTSKQHFKFRQTDQ